MPSYDVAVVGSSPLLLIFALQLRRAGRSVVLFEANGSLGGAWQVEDVEGIGPVECACHLIEWYAGGYEMLSEYSGTRFVASNPQPKRVFPNGRAIPYTSRLGIAFSVLRAAASLGKAVVRVVIPGARERAIRHAGLIAAWRSLRFQLRYRLPGIVTFDSVKRPAEGYVGFMNNLFSQVASSGIVVVGKHVDAVDLREASAVLRHGTQQTTVGRIILGESTRIANLDHELSACVKLADYHHVVVGLPAENAVLCSDYVHTPNDPNFHRVTYVRDHTSDAASSAIYLVQLRKPATDIAEFEQQLGALFRRCGIVTDARELVVYKVFSKQYAQSSPANVPSCPGAVLQRVRTIGDLSRNLVVQSRVLGAIRYGLDQREH